MGDHDGALAAGAEKVAQLFLIGARAPNLGDCHNGGHDNSPEAARTALPIMNFAYFGGKGNRPIGLAHINLSSFCSDAEHDEVPCQQGMTWNRNDLLQFPTKSPSPQF
jgi:hypothetical protein